MDNGTVAWAHVRLSSHVWILGSMRGRQKDLQLTQRCLLHTESAEPCGGNIMAAATPAASARRK